MILLCTLLFTSFSPCYSSHVYTYWAMAWEKAAEEKKAMKAAGRAAANPKTATDEPKKQRKAALETEAAKRPPAAKMAAEKAANVAAEPAAAKMAAEKAANVAAEPAAAKAAPKKATADKAADKATRDRSLEMEVQDIINIDVLKCLVPLTSDEGLPIAKSMWDMMPNNLAVFKLSKTLQVPSSPPLTAMVEKIDLPNLLKNPVDSQ